MDYIRFIAALCLVAGMLWFAVRVLRQRRPNLGGLSLLQYFPLGPRRGVAAVRAYDEVLVLGVTPDSIRLLRSYSIEKLPEDPQALNPATDFKSILGRMI